MQPSLLTLLNNPQAAAAVNDIMAGRYAHERREGRTHEEARAEALDTGDVWTGWLIGGTIERCERMDTTLKSSLRPPYDPSRRTGGRACDSGKAADRQLSF